LGAPPLRVGGPFLGSLFAPCALRTRACGAAFQAPGAFGDLPNFYPTVFVVSSLLDIRLNQTVRI
jgi:hypothetical protein